MNEVKIRNVKKEDIPKVVDIQINGWITAYKEIIDKDYLNNMSKEEKIKKREKDYNQTGFIVAELNNEIVGFCRYINDNTHTKEIKGIDCELLAIYVKSDLKNKGIGTKLFNHVKTEFIKQGKHNMILWCLKDNTPSKKFYTKMGGTIINERPIKIGNKEYQEVCFLYKI